ncbi:hypothetical protein glysoja_016789 [Glycine soja]|nr:hypothetical protein glysoja_016789 [Glycine soja]
MDFGKKRKEKSRVYVDDENGAHAEARQEKRQKHRIEHVQFKGGEGANDEDF